VVSRLVSRILLSGCMVCMMSGARFRDGTLAHWVTHSGQCLTEMVLPTLRQTHVNELHGPSVKGRPENKQLLRAVATHS